jgi:hypothetical protein
MNFLQVKRCEMREAGMTGTDGEQSDPFDSGNEPSKRWSALPTSQKEGLGFGDTGVPPICVEASGGDLERECRHVGVVRTAGLEPARPFGQEILSLWRLPFRHARPDVRAVSHAPHHYVKAPNGIAAVSWE